MAFMSSSILGAVASMPMFHYSTCPCNLTVTQQTQSSFRIILNHSSCFKTLTRWESLLIVSVSFLTFLFFLHRHCETI